MVLGLPGKQWEEGSFGRLLADNSPGGLALVGDDMSVLYVNPAFAFLTGRDPQWHVGRSFLELFDPESVKQVQALAGDRTAWSQRAVCRMLRAEGSSFEVDIMGVRVEYEGRGIHFFAVADVSSRENLLRSLAESEGRFHIAATLTRDHIYEYNRKTDRLTWSSNIKELLGYSLAEMPDTLKGILALTHPENYKGLRDALFRHAAAGDNFTEEYKIRRKDGSYITVLHRSTAVKDADGVAERWIGSLTDVTESRQMEKELRASEERFRIAASLVTDYIYEFNAETMQFIWSSNLTNLLGYGSEEMPLSPKELGSICHPDDLGRINALIIQHVAANTPINLEYRIRRKDGRFLTIFNRSTPVRDEDGRIRRWVGAIADVTESRRMENELRANEEKFRLAATMVSDYVYVYNTERQCFEWPQDVRNFLGYAFDDLPRTHEDLHRLVHPDDRDRVAASTIQHRADLTPIAEEYRIRHRDGRYRLVANRAVPVREADGTVRRWVGAATDVTERRKMEADLRASEERFRLAAGLVTDYIYEFDLETGKFVWSNEISELLGYGPSELPDNLAGITEYIHPEDRERVRELIARHAANQENFSEEYRVTHKDGRQITVLNRATAVVGPDGTVRRWIGTLNEVTESRRLEADLRASEEKFRVAAELATDCIYVWDRHKNPLGLEWSGDIDRILGYGPGEFPRDFKGNNEAIHPEDRPRVLAAIKRHVEDGIPFSLEYRVQRKDGQYMLMSSRGRVLYDTTGEPVRWIGVNTDVTEARRVETELRDSESKFWSFINESAYGYTEIDTEGNVTFLNNRAEVMLGHEMRPGERINFRDLIHPDDLSRAAYDLSLVFTQPNDGPREYRLRRFDGSYLDVEVNTLPLRRQGQIVGFQATVLDVSDRKRFTDELRRRERILQAVARGAETFLRSPHWRDNIFEGLEDIGQAARVKRSYMFRIVGPPGEKFVGELYDWIEGRVRQPEMVARLNESRWKDDPLIQRAVESLRKGEPFTGHYKEFMPDVVRVFPHSANMIFQGVPIFVGGELWGAFGFDYNDDEKLHSPAEIDILKVLANTLGAAIQREQAEETIRESERRYRLVVENQIDVIWTADMSFKMTYFSPSIEKLSGYTVEEALNNTLDQVLTRESLRDFAQRFAGLKEVLDSLPPGNTVERPPVEACLRRKDGRVITIEISIAISLGDDGRPVGFQGTMRDISRRKEAEAALKLSQEKLRAQYNAIPVPTYTWQREGDDFVLVDYNEAAVEITQGTIVNYLKIKASALYQDNPEIIADLERCFRERSVFEREMDYRYHSIPQQKVLVVKYAFVAPDQVIAHTEDITEKKRAMEVLAEREAQLKQTLSTEVRMRRSKDYSGVEAEDENLHLYSSAAWQRTLSEARIAAQSDGVIMLLGKSGVGKTYLAGWIHQHSSRAEGPYFDINCAALTPTLIESELFGHEAGAFTGSKGRRRGLLELAHNGTLFLDEIGDMPLDLQAKLLSFLDTRRFMRVGGEAKLSVNSRVMVATNRDLPALVQKGAFREDLYYRLNVFTIAVPALADRREDIPMLTAGLLRRLAREMGLPHPPVLTPEAIRVISDHSWPGNVRELKNVLERVLLRAENKAIITEEPLQQFFVPGATGAHLMDMAPGRDFLTEGRNFDQAVEAYMEDLVKKALLEAKTKTEAANLLGISRHALNRYCRKFNLS